LVFLHVAHDYRDKGLGSNLMYLVTKRARNMGAKKLYISATPSKHTVDFYMGLGCKLTSEINPELFKLEPEDIHLELLI
jgi:predicted N-acetyltransferase YhbS